MNFIVKIYVTIRAVTKKISDDNLALYAATSSFFVVVCFFPFILFLLGLLQYTPLSSEALLSFLYSVTPQELNSLLYSIVNEVYFTSSVALTSISAIATLWAAGKAFLGITQGLNKIYGVKDSQNYVLRRIISTFYTLILVVILIFLLLFGVFGKIVLLFITKNIPLISSIVSSLLARQTIISLCVLTLFFVFLYKLVPNRKSSLLKELPGAVFAALGWQIFSFIFSVYVNYSNFRVMYGSLATIVFAMLWIYFCMCIVLFGAEINTLINNGILKLLKKE